MLIKSFTQQILYSFCYILVIKYVLFVRGGNVLSMRFYNTVQSLENVKCGNQENAINVVKGGGWVINFNAIASRLEAQM